MIRGEKKKRSPELAGNLGEVMKEETHTGVPS